MLGGGGDVPSGVWLRLGRTGKRYFCAGDDSNILLHVWVVGIAPSRPSDSGNECVISILHRPFLPAVFYWPRGSLGPYHRAFMDDR